MGDVDAAVGFEGQDPLVGGGVELERGEPGAEGLLVAVQRLYLPLDEDPPTGVLRIPAIAQQ